MTNLLTNPSFEAGWEDIWVSSRYAQQPKGWSLNAGAIGVDLLSRGAFSGIDHDPVLEIVGTVPEILHKLADQLPAEERAGGTRALILDGEVTFKLFSNYLPWSATLWQTAHDLTPGRRVVLTVPVQPHYNPKPGGDGSPGACAFRAFCGATEGAWLTFGSGLSDRQWSTVTLYAIVPADGKLTVGATFESRSEAGIDFFTDAWRLEYSDDPEPPTPPECYGLPREDYVRVVNVVPVDATRNRYLTIAATAWDRGRQTVTGSYDDAGIGDLSDKTAVLWDIPAADREEFSDFFLEHYPGTVVRFDGEGASAPPVTPTDPPPPQPPVEPQYTLRSDNLIGLHSGFVRAMTWPYIEQSGVTIQKCFSAGDAWQAKYRAPEIVSIWRKYVGNEEGRIDEKPTIRQSALWYLDQYSAEIETAAANMGLTIAQLLSGIDAIESLNETIPTFNPGQLQRAVEFDVCFAEETHLRYGKDLQTVLLNGAIGNPHETEVHYLIPAARAVCELGGFLGYHPYWTANAQRSFLAEYWPYHAGRWMEWDRVFRAAGLYPRYSLGEMGIVYAHDGVSFNSGLGWKACGSFERYLPDLIEFNRRCLAWNKLHGNRCAGGTIFGYGNWGWDSFELGDGEVKLLLDWSKTL